MSKGRVFMAMSGGVDSSVAAILLLQQGYELVGATFRTFDSVKESCLAKEKGCCSVESLMEARHFAAQLGFEHHIIDFRETFKRCVIDNFVDEYTHGRTPNPCVLCNSHIKWGELLRSADEYGCDYIATGHYAQVELFNGHYYLHRPADRQKDQTYFLWRLTEDNLRRTLFPLGDKTKQQVRQIALEHGFELLSKKRESQEICFVPNNNYRDLLAQYGCQCQTGDYIDAEGNVLGQHEGYANYTIGQRKGLGIALGYPAFVSHIDALNNVVVLGRHDDLYTHIVPLRDMVFRGDKEREVMAQIRYRSIPGLARMEDSGLRFDKPVWAVAPGQSVVIYQDDRVVGGGIIAY